MKKFYFIIAGVIVLAIFITKSINSSVNKSVDSEYASLTDTASITKEKLPENVTVSGTVFKCVYIDDQYARIASDSMILDTSILNTVVKRMGIKCNPVYFHTSSLTDAGGEYATAFDAHAIIAHHPPRSKQDIDINNKRNSLNTEIETLEMIEKKPIASIDDVNNRFEILEVSISSCKNAIKYSGNKEISLLISKLKTKISSVQTKFYPKFRRIYIATLKEKLWSENIEVSGSGSSITLIGGVFANNKNKQQSYEAMYPMLTKYRFKRINFKWYKYDDEYTYWTVKTPVDSKFE